MRDILYRASAYKDPKKRRDRDSMLVNDQPPQSCYIAAAVSLVVRLVIQHPQIKVTPAIQGLIDYLKTNEESERKHANEAIDLFKQYGKGGGHNALTAEVLRRGPVFEQAIEIDYISFPRRFVINNKHNLPLDTKDSQLVVFEDIIRHYENTKPGFELVGGVAGVLRVEQIKNKKNLYKWNVQGGHSVSFRVTQKSIIYHDTGNWQEEGVFEKMSDFQYPRPQNILVADDMILMYVPVEVMRPVTHNRGKENRGPVTPPAQNSYSEMHDTSTAAGKLGLKAGETATPPRRMVLRNRTKL